MTPTGATGPMLIHPKWSISLHANALVPQKTRKNTCFSWKTEKLAFQSLSFVDVVAIANRVSAGFELDQLRIPHIHPGAPHPQP